jgi:hypothetical protein
MVNSRSLSAPPDPRDSDALEDWLEAKSQRLARRIERLLSDLVREVYEEFIASVEDTTLTAAGDPSIIDSIIPRWTLIIPEILPDIEETYFEGGVSAFTVAEGYNEIPEEIARGWTQVVNSSAIDYMAQAANRMLDVGRTVWNDVSKTATRAIEQGLGRDELAAQLRQLSDRFAGYRADVIARTEVNAAYMNGDYEADLALGEFGPLEKVWVATSDARTRPTHIAADNQVRAFSEPFSVGGVTMMIPHAPGAPAKEVVNCRCHYEALYLGDRRPDGSVVTRETQQIVDLTEPVVIETGEQRIAWANRQRQRGVTVENIPEAEEAVINYTNGSGWYSDINGSLRDPDWPIRASELAQRDEYVRQLDNLMAQAPPLDRATITYRGVKNDEFASTLRTLRPGDSFTDAGYVSTDIDRQIAINFARADGVVLEIINPAGTRGVVPLAYRVEVAERHMIGEMEWLLPRNTTFRVVSNDGSRIVVEVVP